MLKLLPFTPDHANSPKYLAWLHDRATVLPLNLPEYWNPISPKTARNYAYNLMISDFDEFYAIDLDGEWIGTARLGHIDWALEQAEIGLMLGYRRGEGHGTATARLLCARAWELQIKKIVGGCMSINEPMQAIFYRLGFKLEGVFRQADRLFNGGKCDHLYFGCFENEYRRD